MLDIPCRESLHHIKLNFPPKCHDSIHRIRQPSFDLSTAKLTFEVTLTLTQIKDIVVVVVVVVAIVVYV